MARLPVELSPICKLVFGGWMALTTDLQRNGWDIAIEATRGTYFEDITILINNKHIGWSGYGKIPRDIYTMLKNMQYDRRNKYDWLNSDYPTIILNQLRTDSHLRIAQNWIGEMSLIDSRPSIQMVEEHEIGQLPVFRARSPIVQPAETLIVEPQSVMQMLEEIRKMQSPKQAEIRKRMENEKVIQHASIFSLEAA